MRRRYLLALVVLLTARPLFAQDAETRAESLRRTREEKATELAPFAPGPVERTLLWLENGRLFERVLSPPSGFYPKIGNITAGSGFSGGPGYRRPLVFGGHADFSTFAAASVTGYWILDARLTLPRLAKGRAFLDFHGRRYDFPSEDFFGLGPQSNRTDETFFDLRNTTAGASGGVRPVKWLTAGGALDFLQPRVGRPDDGRPIDEVFDPASIPGMQAQSDFLLYELFADVNYRQPRGNPRRGGQYIARLQRYDEVAGSLYEFSRFELDLQQYLPIVKDRRVIALRGFMSLTDADAGQQVPFYLQRTLGGPDDLRGFRRFRFRDLNVLLLQAEYRWEIFTAVDGAIFFDAGKVANRAEDLSLDDLESDYGIGFRFGTANGVFLRIEGAFGSSGGKHFILRFGHVF
jgi:hypothetical protein